MINETSTVPKIIPVEMTKIVSFQQLRCMYHYQKNIHLNDAAVFAEQQFDKRKKGADFQDFEEKYHIHKSRAQRILKERARRTTHIDKVTRQ